MALTTDTPRTYELGEYNDLPVAATTEIFEGSAVGDNGSGYAIKLTAGDPFRGFAIENTDNSGGDAGDINVRVLTKGCLQATITSVAITDVGSNVYMSDDNTFTLTAGSNSLVGVVKRYVTTNTCMVDYKALYPSGSVSTNDIASKAVTTAKINDLAVDTGQLAADAVDGTKIDDDAVNSEHIVDGAVDLAHMSVNSIDSDQYVDGSIDLIHLSADCVDGTKIADDAINSEHIADGAIDLAHMSVNSIDSDQYVDGSIDLAHLSADCVDGTKIADDAIDTNHIADGAVENAQLEADAVTASKIADDAVSLEHLDDGILPTHRVIAAGIFTTAGGDAVESIAIVGALDTDVAIVTLHTNAGTARTILTAAAAAGAITVTLSDDPSTTHKINYMLLRAVS